MHGRVRKYKRQAKRVKRKSAGTNFVVNVLEDLAAKTEQMIAQLKDERAMLDEAIRIMCDYETEAPERQQTLLANLVLGVR